MATQNQIQPQPVTNLKPSLKRMNLNQVALPSLATVLGRITEEARTELVFPANVTTFNKMMLETNVATAVNVFQMMISRVPWKVAAPTKSSQEEKDRAKLLNANMHQLKRPWAEYINEALSILQYGFCPIEKVYQKDLTIDGKTFIGWKHFPVISQVSVKNWFFDDKTGTLEGLKQDISNLRDRNPLTAGTSQGGLPSNEKEIGSYKFLLFRHNPKRDNPEGNSPLKQCYITWKYLSIIEEFEVIGVTKDLGGVVVFDVPQEVMVEAAADPTSWQATFITDLEKKAAAITAGDQSYLIMPKVYDDKGNPLYDFKLQGVEGGGKQYNTNELAMRHSKKILMSFFADVLSLGSDTDGSYSLADSKTSLMSMGIEAVLENLKRTLNHDLMRQTYELNGWSYDPLASAGFEYGDLEEEDLEALSGFIQRTMAVGAMRPTSDLEDKLRGLLDLDPMKEAKPEILETENISRAGDGMNSGMGNGVGKSTSKGSDRSKSNKENK